jgi:hypothetical protein
VTTLLAFAAAVVVIALLLRFALRPATVFSIRVDGGEVEVRGSVPGRSRGELRDFLLAHVRPAGAARIDGLRDGHGVRIAFRGGLDEGQQQQVRNFLYPFLARRGGGGGGTAA